MYWMKTELLHHQGLGKLLVCPTETSSLAQDLAHVRTQPLKSIIPPGQRPTRMCLPLILPSSLAMSIEADFIEAFYDK